MKYLLVQFRDGSGVIIPDSTGRWRKHKSIQIQDKESKEWRRGVVVVRGSEESCIASSRECKIRLTESSNEKSDSESSSSSDEEDSDAEVTLKPKS
jgi:hypothetical protein